MYTTGTGRRGNQPEGFGGVSRAERNVGAGVDLEDRDGEARAVQKEDGGDRAGGDAS